jgi:outer membrane protein TolC
MELNVSIAEKAYRLTEQGYRAGTIEYLDLKDAENDLLQARLGVLTEKFNYLNTLLDLEAALNAKLSTEK